MPFVDYNPALDRQSCLAGHSQLDARIYLEESTGRRRCGACILFANRRKYQKRLGITPPPIASRVKVDYSGVRFGHMLCLGLSTEKRGSNVTTWRLRCDCSRIVEKQNAVLTVAERTGKEFFCSQQCPYFIEFCRQRQTGRKFGHDVKQPTVQPSISTPVHEPVPKQEPVVSPQVLSSAPLVLKNVKVVPAKKQGLLHRRHFQASEHNTNAMPTANRDCFESLHADDIGDGPGQWRVVPLFRETHNLPAVKPEKHAEDCLCRKCTRFTKDHQRELLRYPELKESSPHEKTQDESSTSNQTTKETPDIIRKAFFGSTHEKSDSPA